MESKEERRGGRRYSSIACCGDLLAHMLSQMSAQYSSAVGCFPVKKTLKFITKVNKKSRNAG